MLLESLVELHVRKHRKINDLVNLTVEVIENQNMNEGPEGD